MADGFPTSCHNFPTFPSTQWTLAMLFLPMMSEQLICKSARRPMARSAFYTNDFSQATCAYLDMHPFQRHICRHRRALALLESTVPRQLARHNCINLTSRARYICSSLLRILRKQALDSARLGKLSLAPSQIGVTLRDRFGIPQLKNFGWHQDPAYPEKSNVVPEWLGMMNAPNHMISDAILSSLMLPMAALNTTEQHHH